MFSQTACIPLTFYQDNKAWKGGLCLSSLKQEKLEALSSQFLHSNEQAYFSTLQYARRQYSYLLGRFCAKQAITVYSNFSNLTEFWIEPGVFHQPIIYNSTIQNTQVSITHCNTLGGALAFHEGFPMGIDIEEICLDKINVIENQLTSKEKSLFLLGNKAASFTMLWTLKEALSKTLKCGLTVPFEILEIETMATRDNLTISIFKNFKQYEACSFLIHDAICSLVYPMKTSFVINVLELQKALSRSNL